MKNVAIAMVSLLLLFEGGAARAERRPFAAAYVPEIRCGNCRRDPRCVRAFKTRWRTYWKSDRVSAVEAQKGAGRFVDGVFEKRPDDYSWSFVVVFPKAPPKKQRRGWSVTIGDEVPHELFRYYEKLGGHAFIVRFRVYDDEISEGSHQVRVVARDGTVLVEQPLNLLGPTDTAAR